MTTATFAAPRPWLGPLNPPLRYWRGKRVWLIGASSGIGLATAEALIAQGARVIVSARSASALDAFVQRHANAGQATAQSWPLDVTDADEVAAVARAILA
jgi:NAD(P)-dependent dehydrogenase (short-subunit alcohol dehydrogenase family)